MNAMRIGGILCLLLAASSFTSGFLWAAFGVSWWVPTMPDDERAKTLAMFHVLTIVFGILAGLGLIINSED